jgi:quercetin dioxygenase-like cupin family protein
MPPTLPIAGWAKWRLRSWWAGARAKPRTQGKDAIVTLNLRRVVTGHDSQGRAVVTMDDQPTNKISNRPGHEAVVVWTTKETPADLSGDADGGDWEVTTPSIPNGSIFRIIEYAPGVDSRMHRTDTIDYAVILSGEIDMRLDEGQEVHLKAGDVLVQRATIHDWINRSDAPCVIAFVLLDAKG